MSAPELIAGSLVAGKYTVRAILLQGGATATYRAVTAKNREVALKLYDPAILSSPDVLNTLAQHQSIGAKLPPHQIVPIVESGTDVKSGAPYTVTDFQSWPSLAQLIDRGPLPASAMATLVRNLALATDLLHSSGIAGLSLHPGNIFVGPGPQYEVRVADFCASLVRNALPVPEKAGRWMPWLAPEQLKGQAPTAPAADVFALALIAFFAVTGKPYWRSCQAKALDTAALRREILGERMPASVRAGEFSITLNSAVDVVFARALGFRPSDRYSTPKEFATSLEAALSGRSIAEVDAARPQSANVAAASAKASGGGPAAQRPSAPGEAAPGSRRMAPPPRKMPQRTTMLGTGSPAAEEATSPSAKAAGPRPAMPTMLGMGEAAAAAKAAAPAKASAPAMVASAAVVATPIVAIAAAKSPAPAIPVAPAMSAEPPVVVAPMKTAQRGGPPPLPVAPPSAQQQEVLARFEASPPAPVLGTALLASSIASTDGVQTPLAWPTPTPGDSGGERVETGVAVIRTDFTDTPPKSRLRWIASVAGLLILTGGGTWALSGSRTSDSRDRAASSAKATSTAPTSAALGGPVSAEPPSATAQPQAGNVAPQGTEETRTGAPLEPAAPEPAAPEVQEPSAAEPPAPSAASNAAVMKPAIAPRPSAPSQPLPGSVPAAARPQPSKKPCGKFLRRCK